VQEILNYLEKTYLSAFLFTINPTWLEVESNQSAEIGTRLITTVSYGNDPYDKYIIISNSI
jgi:hypothetical protein